MSVNYNVWYRKLGLRKTSDFVYPKIINTADMFYPKYTMIHYFNEDTSLYPNKNIPIFSSLKKAVVTNILKYKNPIFKDIKEKPVQETGFANKIGKQFPDFKTYPYSKLLKKISGDPNLTRNNIVIVNYSFVNEFYRWKGLPIEEKFKFKNTNKTIAETIKEINIQVSSKKVNLNHFFIFDLPPVLYSKAILKKFMKREFDRQLLKVFYNYKFLNFLDLLKAFNEETKNDSSIQFVDKKWLDTVNIIFRLDDKAVIVNLRKLLSYSKLYDIPSSVKWDDKKMFNVLYYFFNLIYSLPAFNIKEIETGEYGDKIDEALGRVNTQKLTPGQDIDIDISTEIETTDNIEEDKIQEDITDVEDTDIEVNEKDIDDRVIEEKELIEENEAIVESLNTTLAKYKTIEEVMSSKDDIIKDVEKSLESLANKYNIPEKRLKTIKEKFESFLNEKSPFENGKTIKDYLFIKDEEIEIKESETKLPESPVVLDKTELEDKINVIDKKYVKDVMKKDIVRTFVSLERAGMVITELKVNKEKSILGEYEEYEINFLDIEKGSHKVKVKIPTVNEDGIYKISGNQYRLRKMMRDIPIKKISPKRVGLSSAYGKLFIDKAPTANLDRGYSLKRELLKLKKAGKIKNLVLGEQSIPDVELPQDYFLTIRYIVSFIYGDYEFNFDYNNREKLAFELGYKLEDVEKNGMVVCGKHINKLLLMDKDNILYEYDGKNYKKIGPYLDFLEIDKSKLKDEFSIINILGNRIPLVYLLIYYLGFKGLLKLTKTKYKVLEGNKRTDDPNAIVFKTKFETTVIEPKDDKERMLYSGLIYFKKQMKNVPLDILDKSEEYLAVLKDLGFAINVITEIKLLDDLYLDPVTINTLKQMNEPTTFTGLLLRANELLVTDYYYHPQALKGYLIKGYDVIPQMIYSQIVDSIRQMKNEEFFGKKRLVFDPYGVWRQLNEDSASILVDDLNPILYLKQKEDVTFTGFGGRKKESMSKSTRELHPDAVGVISEGHKDSGDVGISAYMSANPVLKNIRGMKGELKKIDFANVFSTSALLAPFSTTDDSKRVNFINIQNSHVIPFQNPEVYPVRTGYEAVLPYRLPKKFIAFAEDNGVVEKVGKNEITIKYDNGKKEKYKFKDWNSKEESGSSFLHIMKTELKKGDKVNKGDVIYYDSSFFEPDIFDNRKVIYRTYLNATVALMEINETYEDSTSMSLKFAKKAGINSIKSRSIILKADTEITEPKWIGDKVKPTDALLILTTGIIPEEDSKLDSEALDILQGFIKQTPKAKVKGEIFDIKVFYNCEKDDLSPSLREFVDKVENLMIDPETGEHLSGRVDSSYSIKGKPLEEGSIEIKYFIKAESIMGTGDKGIIANQLKTTVGDIYDYDIMNELGENVDILFSARAIYARVVNSPNLMGTTALLLKEVSKKAVELYFGKSDN